MSAELARFLEAVRRVEGTSYGSEGQPMAGGDARPFGAYGMMAETWEAWSSDAGMGGMDKFDPSVQDYVAANMAQKLFQRYGNWDLVAAAWFGGRDATDQAASSSEGPAFFKNPNTRKYLDAFKVEREKLEEEGYESLPTAAGKWITPQGAPKGWLNPIAGESEWSGGSWMPNTKTHRGRTHAAIDIYSKRGTPIVSPVAGKVIAVKNGKIGGFTATIRGQDGLTYYFAHMDSMSNLKAGDTVGAGNHIGFVGNSGSAKRTKPHLHFSVKKGKTPVNPRTYLEGAKNSKNYFVPEGADHQDAKTPSMSHNLDSLLESVSNQVSGGEREDYRKVGLPDLSPEELAERQESPL